MDLLTSGPADAATTVVLAHGAGAPMTTPFMSAFADGLAHHGIRVARFEFPYMQKRRVDGKRRAPDAPAVLRASWLRVIAMLGRERLVIGGKSLGGRIASMVADEAGVLGLVCLGYPFHPPRQPTKPRIAHLAQLRTPALIVQGTRDTFGDRDEVAAYALSERIEIRWLEDGDHSFKPRAQSGRTLEQNLAAAIAAVAAFVDAL